MNKPRSTAQSVTDRQWERWASTDPYRGVLGYDSHALDDEAKRSFFSSGQAHIDRVLEVCRRFFGEPRWEGAALDFGCGVGRLVRPLCDRFSEVVGVDVSPTMLDIARQNLADKVTARLYLGLDSLENTGTSFDFVHTYIVLQHIRPRQGMLLVERLIMLVKPGGLFAIHLTLGDMKPWRRALNWLRYRLPAAHWAYNLVRGRPYREPISEMNRYNPADLYALFRKHECEPVVSYSFDQNQHTGVMFVGRKQR